MEHDKKKNSLSAATLKEFVEEIGRVFLEVLGRVAAELSQAIGSYNAWKSRRHSKLSIKYSQEAQRQAEEVIQDLKHCRYGSSP